jgi:hypothetical protein
MTELRDRTPTPAPAPSQAPANPGANPGADEADPLHNLYRMSRTAGLGSGDYVAINNTAIAALVLGLASATALLWPVGLVVAGAAIVVGVLAMIQIRSSNGTQTGIGIAAGGILLALVLGGATAGKMLLSAAQHRRDEAKISELVKRLNDLIVAKQYGQAYQTLFSDSFKQTFTEAEFTRRWEQNLPVMGEIRSIDWGKTAEIAEIRGTGEKRAVASSSVKFARFPDPATQPMGFVFHDGEWVIDQISQLFDPPKGSKGAGDNEPMPNPLDPQGPVFDIPGAKNPGSVR